VRLVIPGELAKHAVSEGTKAVTRFTSGGARGGKVKMSRASKAHLLFSISRVENQLRSNLCYKCRLGSDAPVYLAAVLEYITAEILELSGNTARDNRKTNITARHLYLAIHNDEEVNKLFKKRVLAGGGVLPNIHSVLLPKKR